jgi:hypothetical protein
MTMVQVLHLCIGGKRYWNDNLTSSHAPQKFRYFHFAIQPVAEGVDRSFYTVNSYGISIMSVPQSETCETSERNDTAWWGKAENAFLRLCGDFWDLLYMYWSEIQRHSDLLKRDAVSSGKWFLTCRRNICLIFKGQQSTLSHIPEDLNPQQHRCENIILHALMPFECSIFILERDGINGGSLQSAVMEGIIMLLLFIFDKQ